MIDMNEVGAFPSFDPSGNFTVRIGLYLPGIRAVDGFSVVVRIIHTDDRFNPAVPTTDCPLHWVDGHPLDLWSITESIVAAPAPSHYGQEGTYLYRFQLLWAAPGSGAASQILALWFTDPLRSRNRDRRALGVHPCSRPFSLRMVGRQLQDT